MATQAQEESTNRSCNMIGQHIVQEFKSDRQVNLSPKDPSALFRSINNTPLAVGLSLHSYHNHRRKNEIIFWNSYGIGISYGHMKDITKQITCNVQSNMLKNGGVFVPPDV